MNVDKIESLEAVLYEKASPHVFLLRGLTPVLIMDNKKKQEKALQYPAGAITLDRWTHTHETRRNILHDGSR